MFFELYHKKDFAVMEQQNKIVQEKIMECTHCELRKHYAITWDIHFDYLDCPDYLNCYFNKEKGVKSND